MCTTPCVNRIEMSSYNKGAFKMEYFLTAMKYYIYPNSYIN